MQAIKTKHLTRLGLAACALGVISAAGCNGGGAKYVDPNGPDTIVTLDQIDIQDFNKAASDMVQSLLDSGRLEGAPRRPAVMVISRITNSTTDRIDTDLLTFNISTALSKSGKVLTSTTVGPGGKGSDPLAQDQQRAKDFYNNTNRQPPDTFDYSLSGKILQTNASASSTRQVTYTFQLALTDGSGNAIWQDQKQITKQGKHNTVGW